MVDFEHCPKRQKSGLYTIQNARVIVEIKEKCIPSGMSIHERMVYNVSRTGFELRLPEWQAFRHNNRLTSLDFLSEFFFIFF